MSLIDFLDSQSYHYAPWDVVRSLMNHIPPFQAFLGSRKKGS